MFVQVLLGVVEKVVGFVSEFDGLLSLLIFTLHFLSLVDHVLDIGFRKTARSLNGDSVILASGLVLGTDVDDTVGIDIEGDFNLWNTSWCWWNTAQVELTQKLVVSSHFSFSLEDSDTDSGLVVSSGREDL
mmetsp:Transcript_33174/g.38625  ORF Transcript_33174/g.38625 Transcript_33174/m.38625 type:complete len:131 (-) Transcript_33174:541-933(-)